MSWCNVLVGKKSIIQASDRLGKGGSGRSVGRIRDLLFFWPLLLGGGDGWIESDAAAARSSRANKFPTQNEVDLEKR